VVKTDSLVTKIIIENGIATGVEVQGGGSTPPATWWPTPTLPAGLQARGRGEVPKDYVEDLKAMKPANSLFGVFLG